MVISNSLINCYKSCRRLYKLKYIDNLESVASSNALEIGKSYHNKIEQICKNGYFEETGDKTDAMAYAYSKYVLPAMKIVEREKKFEYKLNDKHTLVGIVDGVCESGRIIEDKTTSKDIVEKYIYKLQWDEQILCYMLAFGINAMDYTICRKPTIRQKVNETDEEFVQRCKEWYDECPEERIKVISVIRSDKEIEEHKENLIKLADEIEKCENYFCCPSHCTQWGSMCKYSQVCLDYDPSLEYVDFIKRDRKTEKYKEGDSENELF